MGLNHWLLLGAGIVILSNFIFLFFVSKKDNLNSALIMIGTFLFWVVNTFTLRIITPDKISTIVIAISGIINVFLLFSKPLAGWITGILKSRKAWIYSSFFLTTIALTIVVFDKNLTSWLIVLLAIILGLSQASQSLFFLKYNEQCYDRKEPVKTSFLIGSIIIKGNIVGILLFNIYDEANSVVLGNWLYGILIVFLLAGFLIFFIIKEKKERIGIMNPKLIPNNGIYSSKTLVIIVVVTVLLGLSYSFYETNLFLDYNSSINRDWLTIAFFILPGFFSFIFYHFILKKYNTTYSLIIMLSISMLCSLLLFFIRIEVLYIMIVAIIGFCFWETFFIIFGMAIMWNYRVKNVPITGFAASGVVFGVLIVQIVLAILTNQHVKIPNYIYEVILGVTIGAMGLVMGLILMWKKHLLGEYENNLIPLVIVNEEVNEEK